MWKHGMKMRDRRNGTVRVFKAYIPSEGIVRFEDGSLAAVKTVEDFYVYVSEEDGYARPRFAGPDQSYVGSLSTSDRQRLLSGMSNTAGRVQEVPYDCAAPVAAALGPHCVGGESDPVMQAGLRMAKAAREGLDNLEAAVLSKAMLPEARTKSDHVGEIARLAVPNAVAGCRLGCACTLHRPPREPYIPSVDDFDLLPDA